MTAAARLRGLLSGSQPLVLPGVYDPFGAVMAERAGLHAVYLSGASLAYTLLGRPDLGLVDAGQLVDAAQRICRRVSVPVVVDADTGFGSTLNVELMVSRLAQAGVAAIQLEDQSFPKRCGHLSGKSLVSCDEMTAKLRAALAVRGADGPLIIARTDAVAVEGLDSAIERSEAYVAAGADILFVEALEDESQIDLVARRFAGRVPLLVNQVEGGRTPLLTPDRFRALGVSIVLVPGGLIRAVARTMEQYFESLSSNASTEAFRGQMLDFGQLNAILETEAELARSLSYAADAPASRPPQGQEQHPTSSGGGGNHAVRNR